MITVKQWGALERIVAQATEEELLRLRGMIDDALAALPQVEPAEEATDRAGGDKSNSSKGGGYYEVKMINGCGPYLYERARVNGRLTSTYKGKVKQ